VDGGSLPWRQGLTPPGRAYCRMAGAPPNDWPPSASKHTEGAGVSVKRRYTREGATAMGADASLPLGNPHLRSSSGALRVGPENLSTGRIETHRGAQFPFGDF
jgi:hypothetical protein